MKSAPQYLAAMLTASLLASGCSFAASGSDIIENRCDSDADCPDASCDTESSMCITPTADTVRIGFEITPPTTASGATPATRSLAPFDVDGPARMDVDLPAPIGVFGSVRCPAFTEPVQARVKFIRQSTFPGGAPIVVETTTLGMPTEAFDRMPADYGAQVVAERDYEILVEPTGEWTTRLPPLRLAHTVPGGGDFVRINLDYPSEMPGLQGVLVGNTEQPVDDLVVRAVDPETGAVVSSTTVSGGMGGRGRFQITLDPGVQSYLLRISGGADRPLFPTLLVDPSYFWPDERGIVRILVPMLSAVQYRGTVERGVAGRTVREASVAFQSVDVFDVATGVSGAYRTTVLTNDDGEFEVSLLPGNYEVLITPPSEAEGLGVHTETVLGIEPRDEGDGSIQGKVFLLPDRARLGGTVRTPDARAMGGATVQAEALHWPLEDGETISGAARHNRTNETITDPNGLFNLPLDFGSYDLLIKPPAQSGFPWVVAPGLEFGSSETVMSSYGFSAPIPVAGTVLAGEDGIPLAGAQIRAYAIVEHEGAERAIPVGRAETSEDGSYMLLLPAWL